MKEVGKQAHSVPPSWQEGGVRTSECFRVRIDGRELPVATIRGLGSASELPSGCETKPAAATHKTPLVTLERALDGSRLLFEWRQAILDGRDDRRDVEIELLASAGGEPVTAWRLRRAWPVRWSGPTFDAKQRAVALEEVELACKRIEWV